MKIKFSEPIINWSVWDNSPIVSWTYNGKVMNISMRLPPVSVAMIQSKGMIAIVGKFDEFGSANLMLYSFDGLLLHTFTAPNLGQDSQFGGVTDGKEGVVVIVGFKSDSSWIESSGKFDFKDGSVSDVHRTY